jgi:hypothetical protein
MHANDTYRSGLVTPRMILGLAIALFGVVLVLDRLNIVVADQVLRWWPAVIVAIGALIFQQARHVGSGVNGIIVMAVGGWLLLNSLGILRIGFWQLFWPLVLIGLGSTLVVQAMRVRTREASGGDTDDTVNVFAVLGGVKRTSASTRFRGGEMTAFLGGYQIDLRQATIAPGEEAVLDIFTVLGGGEIFVPSTWTVATPIMPVMGGVEDKRIAPLPGALDPTKPAPRLVLRGLVVLGGIEIKS